MIIMTEMSDNSDERRVISSDLTPLLLTLHVACPLLVLAASSQVQLYMQKEQVFGLREQRESSE